MIKVPITKRARTYGYVIWTSKTEATIEDFFRGKQTVHLTLNGNNLGPKNISYAYRRLSLGVSKMKAISEKHTVFLLSLSGNKLKITTK